MEDTGENRRGRRLDSWKAIASYFGRDERTVKRWEARRGLPVRRVPGGGKPTVYAYVTELDEWLKNGGGIEAEALENSADAAQTPNVEQIAPAISAGVSHRSRFRGLHLMIAAAVAVGIVALAATAVWVKSERTPRPVNVAAYSFYLKGLYSWQTRTPAGLTQAIDDFNKSIADDPNFASAYAGLADCYNLMQEYTDMPAAVAFPKAKAAAERAIALDDDLASAHRSLAFVDFWWSRDVPGAMREFKRALELGPRSAQTHHWYANALAMTGDSADALTEISRAEELSPDTTAILADKALLLANIGRLNEAEQILTQVEIAEPQFVPAHSYLAFVYRLQNNGPDALREMRQSAELRHDPGALAVAAAGAAGYAKGGLHEMSRRIAAKEQELFNQRKFPSYVLAASYSQLGDRDRALVLLSNAIALREPQAMGLRVDPSLVNLHADPRFAALIVRVGLSPPIKM
jgi:tetratricopeptide (TPR) repeat protein